MGHGDNPFVSLRDVARERRSMEQDEPLWTARRAGQLEPEREQALREQAQQDDYVAHMLALTTPLDAQATRALEGRVAALLADSPPAEVVPLRARRRARNLSIAGGLLAVAAALLLMVNVEREPGLALPPYQGTLEGSDREVRGAEPGQTGGLRHISPGAHIRLSVQPLEPLAQGEKLGARLFLLQGQRVEPVNVPVDVSHQGAVRVSAPYDALFGARRGRWDLVLFVGEPSQLPDAGTARAQAARDAPDLRVLHFPVELTP